MAGSMKDVLYTADNGTLYSIRVDESNIDMIMGSHQPANGSYPRIPKNLHLRKVTVEAQTLAVKRVIPVLTAARFAELNGATPLTIPEGQLDAGVAVRVRTKIGERYRNIPRDYDTGKNDGTPD
jgi:hypothetical protein